MIKKFVFIAIFYVACFFSCFAESAHDYPLIKMTTIKVGKAEGQIGWNERLSVGGGRPGPWTFLITNKNEIVIPDRLNRRISVYDISLNYQRDIIKKEEKTYYTADVLRSDTSGQLIGFTEENELFFLDQNETLRWIIPERSFSRRVQVGFDSFLTDDLVFFYFDPFQGKIGSINSNGTLMGTQESVRRLKAANAAEKGAVGLAAWANGRSLPNDIRSALAEKNASLIETGEYIIVDGVMLTSDFVRMRRYFDAVKDIREKVEQADKTTKRLVNADVLRNFEFSRYIGTDGEGNSYWSGISKSKKNDNYERMMAIGVFTRLGTLMDIFYYGKENLINNRLTPDLKSYPASYSPAAVSPAGDIYFMVGSDVGVDFYRVDRRW